MKSVIAIFDIGRTNKKLFLFDEQYKPVWEKTTNLSEIKDEDGFPCENVESLDSFVIDSVGEILREKEFLIRAINFSAYGASFVYLNEKGSVIAPLYNYLKPYPKKLLQQFYNSYGGEESFAYQTASPVLGNLNSGMQLYRIKYENPELFKKITHALHLPQYISYLISGHRYSELTSIGCHTNLWDFQRNMYHEWVAKEEILQKLPPIVVSNKIIPVNFQGNEYKVGVGLHDSSAALIPYLESFQEPFVLISTGTWCITLNPFNNTSLTPEQLNKDCLCYLQYKGKPVKAARLFSGHQHDEQVQRIAVHFQTTAAHYNTLPFNPAMISGLEKNAEQVSLKECAFVKRELSLFTTGEEAYHQLMMDLVAQQIVSAMLVLEEKKIKKIFIDGGFSKNDIYMHLLASAIPSTEVYAASMAQSTALGTAIAIHSAWNKTPIPGDVIQLKSYPSVHDARLVP